MMCCRPIWFGFRVRLTLGLGAGADFRIAVVRPTFYCYAWPLRQFVAAVVCRRFEYYISICSAAPPLHLPPLQASTGSVTRERTIHFIFCLLDSLADVLRLTTVLLLLISSSFPPRPSYHECVRENSNCSAFWTFRSCMDRDKTVRSTIPAG